MRTTIFVPKYVQACSYDMVNCLWYYYNQFKHLFKAMCSINQDKAHGQMGSLHNILIGAHKWCNLSASCKCATSVVSDMLRQAKLKTYYSLIDRVADIPKQHEGYEKHHSRWLQLYFDHVGFFTTHRKFSIHTGRGLHNYGQLSISLYIQSSEKKIFL